MRRLLLVGMLLVIGVVLLRVGGETLQSRLAPEIRHTHTVALFAEIRSDHELPFDLLTMAELARYLSSQTLDWNSCALVDDAIRDGWGRVVTLAPLEPV